MNQHKSHVPLTSFLYLPSTCIAKQTIYKYPYVVRSSPWIWWHSESLLIKWYTGNTCRSPGHLSSTSPTKQLPNSTEGNYCSSTMCSFRGSNKSRSVFFDTRHRHAIQASPTKFTLLRLWLELSDSKTGKCWRTPIPVVAPRWNGQ